MQFNSRASLALWNCGRATSQWNNFKKVKQHKIATEKHPAGSVDFFLDLLMPYTFPNLGKRWKRIFWIYLTCRRPRPKAFTSALCIFTQSGHTSTAHKIFHLILQCVSCGFNVVQDDVPGHLTCVGLELERDHPLWFGWIWSRILRTSWATGCF